MLRAFMDANKSFSRLFEECLPTTFRIDGNSDFPDFVSRWLRTGIVVADIGGGKTPHLSAVRKAALGAHVTGIDISETELSAAPAGVYDRTICADITTFVGEQDADLCICRAVLEHVTDTQAALRAIASILRPGGIALIFVPSRNALFARLNVVLPQRLKEGILFTVFPQARRTQGFPSYYDRCTPRDFEAMALRVGLKPVDARYYYKSWYFSFFLPLHVASRLWLLLFHWIAGEEAAETFAYAFQKSYHDPAP